MNIVTPLGKPEVLMPVQLRVLLVEDSKLLADRLSELIADIDGVDCLERVTTESEAIRVIESYRPDVVVLDLRLLQGTGFNVLRHFIGDSKAPIFAVITNYALPSYRREALALGARYFLDKSLDFDQVPAILLELLTQRRQTVN